MYPQIQRLLKAGYEVSLTPLPNGDVTLTVNEAKNGTCKGVSVDLIPFEWSLVEKGITERLDEAIEDLGLKTEN